MIRVPLSFPAVAILLALPMTNAQTPQAGSASFERLAPINVTGNWVSVVTEDWTVRMLTPPKGDFASLPLNAAGQAAGRSWDPERETGTDACKAYGAPALLRMPGRLQIDWQDGATLRLRADAGQQARIFHFTGEPPASESGWQGYSAASWEYANGFDPLRANELTAGRRGGRGAPPTSPQGGSLKVVTTRLKPGYLRKNGIPYSKDAVLTEYFNVYPDPYGTDWMVVTTILHDPTYLTVDYITSTNFKREPDAAKSHPEACSLR